MSTSVIEPGTRLAGRYRLEERITDSGGSTLWKAIDEILARAVAVRTFDPEFPRVAEVVTSARAASRLTDPRLTQVFDADDSGESAYVVSEWVAGETLEKMLGKAPLEPGRAATLLYEAAEAIAAAHEAGLAHLCLSPRDLVWTTGGTVKLLGIATDAVLADRYADDPAAQDVRGLGGMLYAALTAHWPGPPDRSSLPAAPMAGEVPKAPRQVQAGVPYAVDAIVCRCLGIEVAGQEPLADPAALAQALRGVPRTPLPLFAGLSNSHPAPSSPPNSTRAHRAPAAPPPRRHEHPSHGRTQQQQTRQQHGMPPAAPSSQRTAPAAHAGRPPRSSKGNNRALLGVAAAALTVIVGLGAWALSGDDEPSGTPGATDKSQTSQPAKPQVTKLDVQRVEAAEELTRVGGPDTTIRKRLEAVTDGRTDGPIWETQTYASANFGNLAKGLGVVLDMGKPVRVSSVKVAVPDGGGVLQVKVGDSTSPGALHSLGRAVTTPGENTINAASQHTGRYVLVWFTKLPPGNKGKISEITVQGSAAG
ncbi:protein kinase family protein [Actinomadura viridis]|uniref:protein kinase family protein n=1 Tax=Actinomadura viridis TaxID=58110 RepID=UPI003685ECCB